MLEIHLQAETDCVCDDRRYHRGPTAVCGYESRIAGRSVVVYPKLVFRTHSSAEAKHRGFALVTYGSAADAQDAIDNMDLNELNGRVIKVNMARPMKGLMQQPGGNRAVWESEEWLKANALPLSKSGGLHFALCCPHGSHTLT